MIGEFEANFENCLSDADGSLVLSFRVPKSKTYAAKQAVAAARTGLAGGKERLKISVSWWKEKRSLNANSYFHVLVDKIAKAMQLSADELKVKMVLDYGTVARDSEGDKVGIKLPVSVDVTTIYKYAKWFDTRTENGKKFNCFIIYKETHTLDKTEMARLIDGVVQEAKQLDVETKTQQELADLCSLWEGDK